MSYQAIYRRWRPQVFDDVIGQNHITQTLKNEIINGKTAHAYLFCGTRGTGKTSTAKILAKAVNCENPNGGNPCNECDICRGISDESILDVVEIDAASKTSVDDIRSVIEEAMFSPTIAKKKVYIIDEVHMISESAFNALLKTLEEPPAHVMFILATTELHKIPATILSRCQRFDFRRITNGDIVSRIKDIIKADNLSADDDALNLIAELGDGSMRDALSVLDQAFSFSEKKLSLDDVLSIVGISDEKSILKMCTFIVENNPGGALDLVDDIITSGKDLGVYVERLVKFLRDVLVCKLTNTNDKLFSYTQDKMNTLKKYGELLSAERITNSLRLLNDSFAKAKNSSFSRTIYELCFIKMCSVEIDNSPESLLARISVLEEKINSADFRVARAPQRDILNEKNQDEPPWNEPASKEPVSESDSLDDSQIIPPANEKEDRVPNTQISQNEALNEVQEENADSKNSQGDSETNIPWQKIIAEVKALGGMPIFPHLLRVTPKLHNGKFVLLFDDDAKLARDIVSKPRNTELVADAVKKVLRKDYIVSCHLKKEINDTIVSNDNPFKKLEKLSESHSIIEICD